MSDYLPSEIWAEILHRLDPKSLVRCTSVCKSWKSLITDHAFISDHLTRALQPNHPKKRRLFFHFGRRKRQRESNSFVYEEFFCVNDDNEPADVFYFSKFKLKHLFLRTYTHMVGTCNGLVCLADYEATKGATQIICNPTIRKYVVVPKPTGINERRKVLFGFGFDSRNHDFKLVRLVGFNFKRKKDTPQVLVYSFASNCWRSITSGVPPSLVSSLVRKTSQMFVNGVLHWVVKGRSDGGVSRNFILTFDLVEETFGEMMLPQPLKESPFEVSVLAGGDSLAVALTEKSAEFDGNVFSIWVMKEYGVVESWTEVFHFDSRRFWGKARLLALRSCGEVVLQCRGDGDGIFKIDPVTESVKHKGFREFFNAFAGYHIESLYLINKKNDVLSY